MVLHLSYLIYHFNSARLENLPFDLPLCTLFEILQPSAAAPACCSLPFPARPVVSQVLVRLTLIQYQRGWHKLSFLLEHFLLYPSVLLSQRLCLIHIPGYLMVVRQGKLSQVLIRSRHGAQCAATHIFSTSQKRPILSSFVSLCPYTAVRSDLSAVHSDTLHSLATGSTCVCDASGALTVWILSDRLHLVKHNGGSPFLLLRCASTSSEDVVFLPKSSNLSATRTTDSSHCTEHPPNATTASPASKWIDILRD